MLRKINLLMAAMLLIKGNIVSANSYFNECCPIQMGCCDAGYQLGVWFDPMMVRPVQENLEFARSSRPITSFLSEEQDLYLNPEWSFGFRTGAGIKSRCANWSFRADYTHWCNEIKDSVTLTNHGLAIGAGVPLALLPRIGSSWSLFTTGETGKIASRLRYNYNVLDISAAWSCCVCQNLEVTPYGGFRGFWYSTNVREVNSDSFNNVYSADGDPSTLTNDYSAYGIMGGIRLDYTLLSHLNFYGRFGGSLVAGHNYNQFRRVSSGNESDRNNLIKQKSDLFVNSLEAAFGINYDIPICGFNTIVGVSYEVTQWSELLPTPFTRMTSGSSASLQSNGLFIQAVAFNFALAF